MFNVTRKQSNQCDMNVWNDVSKMTQIVIKDSYSTSEETLMCGKHCPNIQQYCKYEMILLSGTCFDGFLVCSRSVSSTIV